LPAGPCAVGPPAPHRHPCPISLPHVSRAHRPRRTDRRRSPNGVTAVRRCMLLPLCAPPALPSPVRLLAPRYLGAAAPVHRRAVPPSHDRPCSPPASLRPTVASSGRGPFASHLLLPSTLPCFYHSSPACPPRPS
jgi:hypothetical protein